MKLLRLTLAAFVIAVLIARAGIYLTATAQDDPKATQIELIMAQAQDDLGVPVDGQYSITAVLTTDDGKNVGRRSVSFVEDVEFFGSRQASLGVDSTDRKGTASVIYQPSQTGEHTLIAKFAGDAEYASSEAQVTFVPEEVILPFASPPLPLVSVGKWLAVSLAVLGIAFWLVLLGVVGRAVREIRNAGKSQDLTIS